MPKSKTVLRVALAAAAVPGVIIGVAAPAASAAELAPAAVDLGSNVESIQHADTHAMDSHQLPTSNQLNGHDVDLGLLS